VRSRAAAAVRAPRAKQLLFARRKRRPRSRAAPRTLPRRAASRCRTPCHAPLCPRAAATRCCTRRALPCVPCAATRTHAPHDASLCCAAAARTRGNTLTHRCSLTSSLVARRLRATSNDTPPDCSRLRARCFAAATAVPWTFALCVWPCKRVLPHLKKKVRKPLPHGLYLPSVLRGDTDA
jgi:hypothetical protein